MLGVLAMIDDGELDWKVIAINVDDAMASQLNDVDDVETKLPGVVSGTELSSLLPFSNMINHELA